MTEPLAARSISLSDLPLPLYIESSASVAGISFLVSLFFNMLLTAENANSDLPLLGFCILFLLGSKYAALPPYETNQNNSQTGLVSELLLSQETFA